MSFDIVCAWYKTPWKSIVLIDSSSYNYYDYESSMNIHDFISFILTYIEVIHMFTMCSIRRT